MAKKDEIDKLRQEKENALNEELGNLIEQITGVVRVFGDFEDSLKKVKNSSDTVDVTKSLDKVIQNLFGRASRPLGNINPSLTTPSVGYASPNMPKGQNQIEPGLYLQQLKVAKDNIDKALQLNSAASVIYKSIDDISKSASAREFATTFQELKKQFNKYKDKVNPEVLKSTEDFIKSIQKAIPGAASLYTTDKKTGVEKLPKNAEAEAKILKVIEKLRSKTEPKLQAELKSNDNALYDVKKALEAEIKVIENNSKTNSELLEHQKRLDTSNASPQKPEKFESKWGVLTRELEESAKAASTAPTTPPPPIVPPVSPPPSPTPPEPNPQEEKKKEKKTKEQEYYELIKLNVALGRFKSALGPLISGLEDMDKVQRRALATNTSLYEINKLQGPSKSGFDKGFLSEFGISKLGIKISDLGMEILNLRESGIDNLEDSTLKLIARMKLTDQSTASLKKFLGDNSTNLALSTKQAQQLTTSVAEYSQKFGVRQDVSLEFLNKISKDFQLARVAGADPAIVEGITALKAQLGGRGDELVESLSKMISSPDFGASMALGVQPLIDAALRSTDAKETVNLLKQVVKLGGQQVTALTSDLVGQFGQVGTFMAKTQLESMGGGTDLTFLPLLAKALEEVREPSEDMKNYANSILAIKNAFAEPLQLFAKSVTMFLANPIVNNIAKFLARMAGVLSVAGSLVMAVRALTILIPMVTAMMGPIGWIALGIGALAGIMGLVADNTEEINEKTEDKRQFKPTNLDSGLLNYINNSIMGIMSDTDRSDRILEINTKMLEEQRQVRQALTLVMARPEKPLNVTRP